MPKQRPCIFCGRLGGLSKEHFWPMWLAPFLRHPSEQGHITEIHSTDGKGPKKLRSRIERQGYVTTKKIRVVCKSCNSGWMSALEKKVMPTILNLVHGVSGKLDRAQIESLSRWAVVKTVVGEHSQADAVLTPTDDRRQICNSQIPAYFRVYAGIHSSETSAAYIRHSTTISRSLAGPNPPLARDEQRNIQSVTFLMGPVVLHVLAARVADFDLDTQLSFRELVPLWPLTLDSVDFFSLVPLDNNGLSAVAQRLDNFIKSHTLIHGGPIPHT